MDGSCPNCRTRLEFPRSGTYQCERCRSRFEVALGSPVAPAPVAYYSPSYMAAAYAQQPMPAVVAMPTVDASLQAPCVNHAANPAAGVCERCGDFICRLCTTAVEGRAYCPKCFDLLYTRGSLGFAQRQFTAPATTLTLGIVTLFIGLFPCAGIIAVPTGIGGLVLGFRGLKELAARPDLRGKNALSWGIALNILGIVGSIGWLSFLIWKTVSS